MSYRLTGRVPVLATFAALVFSTIGARMPGNAQEVTTPRQAATSKTPEKSTPSETDPSSPSVLIIKTQPDARPATIRNGDVIRMTKEGTAESAILDAVKNGRSEFDTTIPALVVLKKEGVSDKVIATIMESVRPAPPLPLRDADLVTMAKTEHTDAAIVAMQPAPAPALERTFDIPSAIGSRTLHFSRAGIRYERRDLRGRLAAESFTLPCDDVTIRQGRFGLSLQMRLKGGVTHNMEARDPLLADILSAFSDACGRR
jgi:hypothetical protein